MKGAFEVYALIAVLLSSRTLSGNQGMGLMMTLRKFDKGHNIEIHVTINLASHKQLLH